MTDDGAAQFRAAAKALKGADKVVRREVVKAFEVAARPLSRDMAVTAASEMPKRGGLAYEIAGARATIRGVITRNPQVSIGLRVWRRNWYLGRIDDGTIRHPVFALKTADGKRLMRDQKVRPGAFTRPFEAGREPVAREALKAMQAVADQIARDTEGHGA